jgi:hypothetical protein
LKSWALKAGEGVFVVMGVRLGCDILFVVCYCVVATCTWHLYVLCVACLLDGIVPRQYMDKQRGCVLAHQFLAMEGESNRENKVEERWRLRLASVRVPSSVVMGGMVRRQDMGKQWGFCLSIGLRR